MSERLQAVVPLVSLSPGLLGELRLRTALDPLDDATHGDMEKGHHGWINLTLHRTWYIMCNET